MKAWLAQLIKHLIFIVLNWLCEMPSRHISQVMYPSIAYADEEGQDCNSGIFKKKWIKKPVKIWEEPIIDCTSQPL